MAVQIVNKVAESGLITIDLAEFLPSVDIVAFDLKDYLYMDLLLKEKDFRERMQQLDWEYYREKIVTIYCSNDAILPLWAYMLVTTYLQPFAIKVYEGAIDVAVRQNMIENLEKMDLSRYKDARVVIKGCGDKTIQPYAFVAISEKLRPIVKSLMFGEPCSTVPIYKQKN